MLDTAGRGSSGLVHLVNELCVIINGGNFRIGLTGLKCHPFVNLGWVLVFVLLRVVSRKLPIRFI
jgi:hypothetical protein